MHRPQRITPQPPDEWHDAARAALATVVPSGTGRPVRLPAVIARHPTLLPPYLEWAKAVAGPGVLPPRVAALVVLRTAVQCRSEFEWDVHAARARHSAVLTDDEIAAVAEGVAAPRWSAIERTILTAVDELAAQHTIGDATWASLAAELDDAAMVELVLLVGHYTMLSLLANAVGLPPAAG